MAVSAITGEDTEGLSFEEASQAGRPLVRAVFNGHVGAARVFSAGLNEAKARAEAQARDKHARAGG